MNFAGWTALLTWLGEHSPPLVAGFLGGIIGSLFRERLARKRKEE